MDHKSTCVFCIGQRIKFWLNHFEVVTAENHGSEENPQDHTTKNWKNFLMCLMVTEDMVGKIIP